MGPEAQTISDRFMRFVSPDPNSGCWLWVGSDDGRSDAGKGYGKFGVDLGGGRMRMRSAHRVSYEIFVGTIPEGLQIDHLCRVKCCVNPQHLEPVTAKENCIRAGAGNIQMARTHCPKGHPYSGGNLYVKRSKSGGDNRICRECAKENNRIRYRSNKLKKVILMPELVGFVCSVCEHGWWEDAPSPAPFDVPCPKCETIMRASRAARALIRVDVVGGKVTGEWKYPAKLGGVEGTEYDV